MNVTLATTFYPRGFMNNLERLAACGTKVFFHEQEGVVV